MTIKSTLAATGIKKINPSIVNLVECKKSVNLSFDGGGGEMGIG